MLHVQASGPFRRPARSGVEPDEGTAARLGVAVRPAQGADPKAVFPAEGQDRKLGEEGVEDHLTEVEVLDCHGVSAFGLASANTEDLPHLGYERPVQAREAPPALALPPRKDPPCDLDAAIEGLEGNLGNRLGPRRDAAVHVGYEGFYQLGAAHHFEAAAHLAELAQRYVKCIPWHATQSGRPGRQRLPNCPPDCQTWAKAARSRN
jgi:hypothetical protein